MTAQNLPAIPTPAPPAPLLAGLVGDPHAAAAGLFVGVVVDRANNRAHIGLDAPAADALSTLVDNVVNAGIGYDPGAHGLNQDDADDLLAVAHAIHGPLLALFGFQPDRTPGQFTADPYAAARGLHVSVGIDKPTGRAIITLDRAAAAALDLVLDQLDDDDTGQPDHIARPMIRTKYAISGGLGSFAAY
jgi:hypothetical protein